MADCKSCPSKDTCNTDKSKCAVENNPLNHIKHVIGVMSGKGGVGKSTISALIANDLVDKGFSVGVLDADITGPSIPRLLGLKSKKAVATQEGIIPVVNPRGIKAMSLNFLLEEEKAPVIWRGPLIAGTVKQFWTEVIWGDLDYLVVDLPPGTGDVALTIMQSIPLAGVVMVSVPQDMVSMIVSKAMTMTRKMNVEVFGIVENMSYIQCPDCDTKIRMYEDITYDFIEEENTELLGELPMKKEIVNLSRSGISELSAETKEEIGRIVERVLTKIK